MNIGDRTTVTVERTASGGSGLARIDGRVVFLTEALPGELLEIALTEIRKDFYRAKTINVIDASPDRIAPVCGLYGICGGCSLMHVRYQAQTSLKAYPALEKIMPLFKGDVELVSSPEPLHYRSRVRFHIAPFGGTLRIGFYAEGGRTLVPVDYCHQLNRRINDCLPELAEWVSRMANCNVAPEGMTILAGGDREKIAALIDFSQKPDDALRRLINDGPALDDVLVDYTVRGRREGKRRYSQEDGVTVLEFEQPDVKLIAIPGVFTQVNPGINSRMIKKVLQYAEELKPSRVLDLYSGIGNFSMPLSKASRQVTAVEDFPLSVENAGINKTVNSIKNINLIKGDAEKAAREMAMRGEKYDMIVMDPPRAGARGLAGSVSRLGAEQIVYVSCHPAAMARDLAEFSSMGLTLSDLTVFDMFPQTSHLEIMARLVRC